MVESIAFVVMPFDRKPTERAEGGVPAEIDFDALWLAGLSELDAERVVGLPRPPSVPC
jgi:hypothetical protein